ncbi:putative salt tolerance-like protein [Forsythia ovata]|uniref:Salt tolerance-like protein n=1 Tax=Forsythia ovata TaxID=205694 RepID=A0ABD1VNQ5_9LAMI
MGPELYSSSSHRNPSCITSHPRTQGPALRSIKMKIQCDVCDKDEAILFCVADEAALCDACDRRVHHANKLAGKHERFSLLQPSPKQALVCDICQERRALLFCQQDRAILCKECDESIHSANEHTSKHNRFLLTGGAENDMFPFSGADIEGNLSGFSPENMGSWVPQAPFLHQTQNQLYRPLHMAFWDPNPNGIKESKEVTNIKSSRKWSDDNSFAVPQISPHSKKSTTFW